MTGTVKFFNDAKGFGFIVNDETNEEVFVHFTGIVGNGHKSLTDGQKVTYDVEQDEKTGKTRACNVK